MFTGCAPLCVNMAGCCLWLPLSHSFILNLLLLFSWSGGEHHSRKTAIEKYPYLSAVVVFLCFWEVIQALNATRSVSEANRKITYAWVGTCLRWWWHPVFSSLWKNKTKKSPLNFSEGAHKRLHVWKRTESDRFLSGCACGKTSFKAGHRDRRKIFIRSSLLLSPPPHQPPFLL